MTAVRGRGREKWARLLELLWAVLLWVLGLLVPGVSCSSRGQKVLFRFLLGQLIFPSPRLAWHVFRVLFDFVAGNASG